MSELTGVLGGLLVAVSGGAAIWLARRELVRSRARHRLGGDEDEAPASARPERAAADLQPPVGWTVIVWAAVFAVCAALGWDWFLSAGIGMVAGALTHVALAALAKRRSLRLEEGLAEAIGLASSALRAGASPVDAFERAARAVRGPARGLLLELAGGLRLGGDVDQALERLVNRVPLESYRLFAIALAVQWSAGGSLDRSLAVVARAVRDRVELERRIFSQASPTRASVFAFVVATGGIAYLMWQHDPANVEHFLASGAGSTLVGAAIWLQALGILWMWQLSRIRV